MFHPIPSSVHLTLEWSPGPFKNRPDLVGQRVIPNLARQVLEIWMSVPARHVHGKCVAEVQGQIMEIVVAVAPVHVSKIENGGNRLVFGEQVIAAEVSMQDDGVEREVLGRAAIGLEVQIARGLPITLPCPRPGSENPGRSRSRAESRGDRTHLSRLFCAGCRTIV